tara:strand:+ start:1866 stop:5666 length:3801 start_codon:yes stop_codon:yes gene_type:complete
MTDVNVSFEEDNSRPSVTGKPLEVTISPNYYDNPAENPETYGESFRTAEFQEEPGFQNLPQNRLMDFRENFDIEGVAKSGIRDDDVIDYIKKVFPDFNYDKAIEDGAKHKDIIAYFTKATPDSAPQAYAEEALRGFTKVLPSAAVTFPLLTGAMMFPPPAWPITIPASLIGAFLLGEPAGEQLKKMLLGEDKTYTPNVRPWAKAGEFFGTNIPLAAMPSLFAKNMVPGNTRYLSNIASLTKRPNIFTSSPKQLTPGEKILRSSIQSPIPFMTAEIVAGGTASYGTALAEKTDAGNTNTRLLYETLFGVLSPSKLLAELVINTGAKAVSFADTLLSPQAAQSREGKALRKWLIKNRPEYTDIYGQQQKMDGDEYIQRLLNLLNKEDEIKAIASSMNINLPRTTASVTNDPVLKILQGRLLRDKTVGINMKDTIRKEYEGLQNLIHLMMESGDPGLMQQAVKLNEIGVNNAIATRLEESTKGVVDAAAKFGQGPRARQKFSETLEKSTDAAIKDLRAVETSLYEILKSKKYKDVSLQVSNFLEKYGTLMQDDQLPSLDKKIQNLFNTSRGINEEAGIQNISEQITYLNNRITQANTAINKVGSSFPESKLAVENLYANMDNTSAKDKLTLTQNILRLRETDAFKKENAAALKQGYGGIEPKDLQRQNRILGNKAQIFDNMIKVAELDETLKTTPKILENIPVSDVLNARSYLLRMMRQTTDPNEARKYDELADAIRQDLFSAAGGSKPSISALEDWQKELFKANQFSQAFHDVFSRAFAGDVLKKAATGARRISPELLAKPLLSGGGDASSLRLEQITAAINRAGELGFRPQTQEAFERAGTVQAAQEGILRALFDSKAVIKEFNDDNKLVGVDIDRKKLKEFIRELEPVFFSEDGTNLFPELYSDIMNANTAKNLLQTFVIQQRDEVPNQLKLAAGMGDDFNPVELLHSIIATPGPNARTPHGARTNLTNWIKQTQDFDATASEPGAVEGLKSVIFDQAFNSGIKRDEMTGTQSFQAHKVYDYLTTPLAGKNSDSVLDVLRKTGVVDDGFMVRLTKILDEGKKVQQSQKSLETPDDKNIPESQLHRGTRRALDLLFLRIGRYATKVTPGEGQGLAEPMIAKEAGSSLYQVPAMKSKELIFEAAADPKVFKLLLESTDPSSSSGRAFSRRFRSFLVANGYLTAADQERYESEREVDPTTNVSKPRASSLERERIERSPVRTQPPNLVPHLTKSKPVGPLSGKVSTDAARNYAALNPNDLISPLLSRLG